MQSIIYRYPLIYDWSIRFLYFDGLKILKDIIGKNRRVFEPACGYGRMKNYMYPDCQYAGIDLNHRFIRYGQRKNRDIRWGNVLDAQYYRSADTILLCDILHHLEKNDIRKLLNIAAQFATEKIVIIEPTFVSIGSKKNLLSRGIGKFMAMVDFDGHNPIRSWMSKEEYRDLFLALKEENHIDDMRIRRHRKHDFVEMIVSKDRKHAGHS
ncbi:MAG: class I SAM-dependent methyltransferase [Candidatus Omnitrophota bacterium]